MWKEFEINPKFLDDENIIAKLHLVAQLEKSDPYASKDTNNTPLIERIREALVYVPKEYQQYVLAVFANVIYLPKKFSHSVLWYLLDQVLAKYDTSKNNFVQQSLFLEVDPTGMINNFIRYNNIPGRLDKGTFQRTQQVSPFVKTANKFLDGYSFPGEENVLPWLDKKFWVILTDNALSGTSLCSDLERLIELTKKANKNPEFIILARALTSTAKKEIEKLKISKLSIETGLFLDEKYVISEETKDKCCLFKNVDTKDGVLAACKWLADSDIYKYDKNIEDHKSNSGDDLRYGFKKCGLTLVASENCPSNSLPLLWYRNYNLYEAPFPRVLSRIGGEKKSC
ncbi:phosphoribosyltransferase-like protein [Pseudobacteroides cellulosolvens]|uniref:PRTase-CE domain-containing protein n=1 Tax=Pseudobacteroides cellulosolvens ATCC 35603 = DSM 2933 TaxID=398512 RepID=A0A0L6JYF2_9FIRM|nr:hypothetical protein [Pseudobacteroides cellulosolvens]KNY30560.1 hypothetical protein Bccel_5840 [Pseudobacteroides cellulosolvens ATCC 35603 = DSM 2933]